MSLSFPRFDVGAYLIKQLTLPAPTLTDDNYERFEERAAIMEFDGKIQRTRAEMLALAEITSPSYVAAANLPELGFVADTKVERLSRQRQTA